MLRLSKRLAAIAALVPSGAAVIDVGTDHGQLPVWLVQSGKCPRAAASDVNPGPLSRAAALVEEEDLQEKVSLCVCDGLDAFGREDADCVVIAGMGGETMVHILSKASWVKESVLLVLQMQSKEGLLRRWLLDNRFCILSESLVEDAGRIYPLLTAQCGKSPEYTAAELHLGRWEQIGGDPLLPAFLDVLYRKTEKAAPHDPMARELLNELVQWKERL